MLNNKLIKFCCSIKKNNNLQNRNVISLEKKQEATYQKK